LNPVLAELGGAAGILGRESDVEEGHIARCKDGLSLRQGHGVDLQP
jgi:hypothetical protein